MSATGRETRYLVIGSVLLVGVVATGYWAYRRRRCKPVSRRRQRSVKQDVKTSKKGSKGREPTSGSDLKTAHSSSSIAAIRRRSSKTTTFEKDAEQISVGPLSDEDNNANNADRVKTPLPSSHRGFKPALPKPASTEGPADNFDFCPVIVLSPTRPQTPPNDQLPKQPESPLPQSPKLPTTPATPTTSPVAVPSPTHIIPDVASPIPTQSPPPTTAPPSVGNLSAPTTPASTASPVNRSKTNLRVMCDCRISRDADSELTDDNSLFSADIKFAPTQTNVYPISFEKHEPPNLIDVGPGLLKTQLSQQAMKRFHPPGAKESVLTAFRAVLNSLVYANKHAFVITELSENYQYLE